MKNRKVISITALLVIVSLSCNFGLPNSQPSHIANINSISQSATHLPVLDPAGKLPSPGAVLLRTLPPGGADISALTGEIEAAEQAALKAGAAGLKAKMPVSSIPLDPAPLSASPFSSSAYMLPSPSGQPADGEVHLMSYNQPEVIQAAEAGLSPASVIGLISSMFIDIFNIPKAFPTQKFNQTEKEGDVTTNMSMEMGRSEDGSNHFGMGLKSEGTKNGASVKTDLSATIDGQRCPTAEGQVSFSIKATVGSQSGGTGTTQDLTTFVRAVVNDDAEIASSTFDVKQATTQVKGGRQVYLETGETLKYGPDYSNVKESNWRVDQKTDNVTQEDANNLDSPGLQAALELGIASLASAQLRWQDGGCVKIVAASPGTVEPGSTTAIPVNVISIFEGANAPSKINAALTGAKSLDPTLLAKTPGTLNYTAPQEKGKTATITLTATSRRGKATLKLTANTGEKFSANGTWGNAKLTGLIDTLSSPFTLASTGGGDGSCNGKVVFSGGTTGGDVTCSQTCAGGLYFEGNGSYSRAMTKDGETISGQCSSYLPASKGLDTPNIEPINVTLQPVP